VNVCFVEQRKAAPPEKLRAWTLERERKPPQVRASDDGHSAQLEGSN